MKLIAIFSLFAGCHQAAQDAPTAQPNQIQSKAAEPVCGDVLTRYANKPPALEFVGSKKNVSEQIFCEATYRVPGTQAAQIERLLIERHGIESLVFSCCGWERQTGKLVEFRQSEGSFHYHIAMFSDETTLNDRADWAKIPYFYVEAQIAHNI